MDLKKIPSSPPIKHSHESEMASTALDVEPKQPRFNVIGESFPVKELEVEECFEVDSFFSTSNEEIEGGRERNIKTWAFKLKWQKSSNMVVITLILTLLINICSIAFVYMH